MRLAERTRISAVQSPYESYYATASITTPGAAAAPTDLVVSPFTSEGVTLTWADACDSEEGFRIEWAIGGGGFSFVDTTSSNCRWYDFEQALSPQATYHFRVRADSSFGDSGWATATITTPAAPGAPTNLDATAISASSVTLAWTDNATDEDGFIIECSANGTDFRELGTVAANPTMPVSIAAAFEPSTDYTFRVKARNSFTASAGSTTDLIATAGYPAAPTELSATGSSTSAILLSWTNNAINASSLVLEYTTDEDSWQSATAITLGPNDSEYAAAGLVASHIYYFRLKATNGAGDSYHACAHAATWPSAPQNVSAVAVDASAVAVGWDSPTGTSPVFYHIYDASDDALLAAFVSDSEYLIEGLDPSTTYSFHVVAVDWYDQVSLPSSPASTATLSSPTAPTGIAVAMVTSQSATLTWMDNSTDEGGFEVQAAFDVDMDAIIEEEEFVTVFFADADSTSAHIPWLDPSTTYQFRVRSWRSDASSDWSGLATATTLGMPPSAPLGLYAGADGLPEAQIGLYWSSAAGEAFRIERSGDGMSFEVVAPESVAEAYPGQWAAIVHVPDDRFHYYRVIATGDAGDSTPSEPILAATRPWSPSDVSVTEAGIHGLAITWRNNSTRQIAYQLEYAESGTSSYCTVTLPASVTSWSLWDPIALDPIKDYDVRLRAAGPDAGGCPVWSDFSAAATGSPAGTQPEAPVAWLEDGGVDLWVAHWSYPDRLADEFTVERRRQYNGQWTAWIADGAGGPDDRSWAGVSLAPEQGAIWEVRVGARNANSSQWAYSAAVQTDGANAWKTDLDNSRAEGDECGGFGTIIGLGGVAHAMLMKGLSPDKATFDIPASIALYGERDGVRTPILDGVEYTVAELEGVCSSTLRRLRPYTDVYYFDFLVEGIAASASAGDQTLSVDYSAYDPCLGLWSASSDAVAYTVVSEDFTARRAGERWGEAVGEATEAAGNSDDYVILVNDDREEGGILGADLADRRVRTDGVDDDLAGLTLRRLPEWLTTGVVSLSLSDTCARVYHKSGMLLYGDGIDNLRVDLANPNGPLAALLAGDVDLYLEGADTCDDLAIELAYAGDDGRLVLDEVHMRIARWSFVDERDQPALWRQSVQGDVLTLAAAGDPHAAPPPDNSKFRSHIQCLPHGQVAELRVTSSTFPADRYIDALIDDGGHLRSDDLTVFYFTGPDSDRLSSIDRSTIKRNLGLNVVHDTAATARLETRGGDVHLRRIDAVTIDLDADTDNSAGFEFPERNVYEECAEDGLGRYGAGKVILVSDWDSDGDGLPDFADGFNYSNVLAEDNVAANSVFVPIVLELRGDISDHATVRVDYSQSRPGAMRLSLDGPYELPEGGLRIWRSDGSAARSGMAITDGGDYIASQLYSLDQLGLRPGESAVFYVEAVRPSNSARDLRITVSVDPTGDGRFSAVDSIHFTATRIALLGRGCESSQREVVCLIESAPPGISGAYQAHQILVSDPRGSEISHVFLNDEAIPASGGSTPEFMVGVAAGPVSFRSALTWICVDEPTCEISYNPKSPHLKRVVPSVVPRQFGKYGTASKKVIADMKADPTWRQKYPKDTDASANGKEMHARMTSELNAGKDKRWMSDVYVNVETKKVVHIGDNAPANIQNNVDVQQIDHLYMGVDEKGRAFTLKVGDDYKVEQIESIHDLKCSVKGDLTGNQKERYLKLSDGGRKLYVTTPEELYRGGQWTKNPAYQGGLFAFKLLGIEATGVAVVWAWSILEDADTFLKKFDKVVERSTVRPGQTMCWYEKDAMKAGQKMHDIMELSEALVVFLERFVESEGVDLLRIGMTYGAVAEHLRETYHQ